MYSMMLDITLNSSIWLPKIFLVVPSRDLLSIKRIRQPIVPNTPHCFSKRDFSSAGEGALRNVSTFNAVLSIICLSKAFLSCKNVTRKCQIDVPMSSE